MTSETKNKMEIETVVEGAEYNVHSASGKTYRVKYEGSGDGDPEYCAIWSCTCPAAKYRSGPCKHMRAVIEQIDN